MKQTRVANQITSEIIFSVAFCIVFNEVTY